MFLNLLKVIKSLSSDWKGSWISAIIIFYCFFICHGYFISCFKTIGECFYNRSSSQMSLVFEQIIIKSRNVVSRLWNFNLIFDLIILQIQNSCMSFINCVTTMHHQTKYHNCNNLLHNNNNKKIKLAKNIFFYEITRTITLASRLCNQCSFN